MDSKQAAAEKNMNIASAAHDKCRCAHCKSKDVQRYTSCKRYQVYRAAVESWHEAQG